MARKSPELVIEEMPGDRYPSLKMAQRAAAKALAFALAETLRSMAADGLLGDESECRDLCAEG